MPTCDISNVTTLNRVFYGEANFNGDVSRWSVGSVTDVQHAFHGATTFNINLNSWDVSSTTDMAYAFAETVAFNQPLGAWVTSGVTSLEGSFHHAVKFNQPLNVWNISGVTTLAYTFWTASAFNQPLASWDTRSVVSLCATFHVAAAFNQPLNEWNISGVTTLANTFYDASAFNQPLNEWDTRSVTSLRRTFSAAAAFNQPLDEWNISGVTTLAYTFWTASAFNQPLASWDTRSVVSLCATFHVAAAFNQPLNEWNISGVTTLANTFCEVSAFNQPLNEWDTRSVTSLHSTFSAAAAFNQPLNEWNISAVTTLAYTFWTASVFNQPLNAWNTHSVVSLHATFRVAAAFNQPLSNWNVSSVTTFTATFAQATSFDQDLSRWTLSRDGLSMSTMFYETNLSTCNKASMRNEWGAKQNSSVFLKAYSFWPQQCLNNNGKCQAWQKRGIGDNAKCAPALWLDARACMAHVWNGTHRLNEGQVGNSKANGAARHAWASPLLDHAPDQVSIKHGACTHLPGLSQAFKHSMDPFVERLGQHLRSKLEGLFPLGDNFGHNLGDGVSALVQFDERSTDLFIIRLMASSIDNACASSLVVTDGSFNARVNIATTALSLKNISIFSSERASECHDTEWTPGIGLSAFANSLIEEALATAGRLPGEPEFALSRFPPDYKRKRNATAPPTMACLLNASLVWPFKLSAVIGPDDPDKEHVLQVFLYFLMFCICFVVWHWYQWVPGSSECI